ncbi:MAG: universal stress protein [Pseudomonadota bacterium]
MTAPLIAVATDFSSRADRAVDRGWQIGRDMAARVRFIHAIELADARNTNRVDLDRKMSECVGASVDDESCEFLYPEGSPPKAIAGACQTDDVALLVVGPARYNTLGDYFLGTSVDYVLRHTTKPVLVVKNRARGPYRRIIAGTDFSPGSAHSILTAAQMFPDAAIHITHAWEVPFKALQQDSYVAAETQQGEAEKMEKFKAALIERDPALANATYNLVQGGPLTAIRETLASDTSALVVMGSHGTSGWRQAAIGSVTSDLLRYIESDVLVVNTKGA